ncbi:MAG: NYN domain-containing protein, partial [Cylindrospermopsis raciborskii]
MISIADDMDNNRGLTMMLNNLENDSIFTPEQVLENRGRVAIFIDGSNLFYAALQLGIEIDYT